MHGSLDARARFIDRVDVRSADDHDVNIVRNRPVDAMQPDCEGAVEERRLDPVDTPELLSE